MIPLPVCRWRREPTVPGRFGCASPKILTPAHGVTEAQCRQCFCCDHPPPPAPRGRCVHLGPRNGAIYCPDCSRKHARRIELPRHDCARHGLCTLSAAVPGVACCEVCPDYNADSTRPAAGRVRHLTYFVYPFGPSWIWHLQCLKERLSLFNGSRTVAVAVGPETATAAEVASVLDDATMHVQEFANDGGLKEMVAFPYLLSAPSAYRGPEDCTLYAHAKGAGSEAWGSGVRRWSESMISGLLDYWPAVAAMLQRFPVVGCWRRVNFPFPGTHISWHYSGTWRWVRNADLYQRNWSDIDRVWFGSETHAGKHFRQEEAANIYGEIAGREIALYLGAFWDEWAQREVDQWRAAHAADRQRQEQVTVILTSHRQAELVHEAIRSVQEQTSDSWQLLIMDSGDLASSGAFDRYRADARIMVSATGETAAMRNGLGMQSWAINEAWRRKLVRGDLVAHLSDDDVLAPHIVQRWLSLSRLHPEQGAWYGPARRIRYKGPGQSEDLGTLETVGTLRPGNAGRCRVDGMQVCHRRAWRTPWPEEKDLAGEADGVWMDRLAARCPIHAVAHEVGTHRHTPLSTFTTA